VRRASQYVTTFSRKHDETNNKLVILENSIVEKIYEKE